jgi:hypothetical protein
MALLVEVPEQSSCRRFNCNTNNQVSDQFFWFHNAESRMDHPAFARQLQGLVAGVRFELTTFGLCDLTQLSLRVGLYLHPG